MEVMELPEGEDNNVSVDKGQPVQESTTVSHPHTYRVPVVFEKTTSKETEESETKYACIISKEDRPQIVTALESLGHVVCYSSDGRNLPDHIPDECDMVFVCEEFEGDTYDYLHSRKLRIVGPPCVFSCTQRNRSLPNSSRPVFSCTMEGVVICFTGFKDRAELKRLCTLAHRMGASISNDVVSNVTHIVAHCVSGSKDSKYQVAVARGTAIMAEEWISKSWEQRDNPTVSATGPDLMQLKQVPFKGCVIAVYGFPDEEEQHMKEIAADNGAVNSALGDPELTHLVVSDEVDPTVIPTTRSRVKVVKPLWFWESIQIEACVDEQLYLAKESSHRSKRRCSSINSSLHASITSMDISCLLEASLFSLSSPSSTPSSLTKRDSNRKSPGHGVSPLVTASGHGGSSSSKVDTARRHIASELLQTEKNYVEILSIITKVFREPLERPQQRGGPILSNEDIKTIFGNIPEILTAHQELVAGLEKQLACWSEKSCIGNVLMEQAEGFLRVYPPFVNFFDMSKETLHKCDKTYPRFHAFLKVNESRPECSRQTLAQLLINPIQRIPRIILLIQDLVKHTAEAHPDYATLQKAVESLKTVMNHINEDRRKTEGQMQMFEVLRDVEGCPATILSSHRTFLRRLDVLDIGNPSKGTKGDALSMFVFSDSIEVAKRRPVTSFSLRNSTHKMFKHLEFVPLTHIRSVAHFGDDGDVSQSFGLLVRWPEDPQEKLLLFRLSGDHEVTKNEVIQLIAKLLADVNFSTNPDHFVISSSPELFNSMCKSAVSSTTLKRALHGAKKKVKRAFSGRQSRRTQNLASVRMLPTPYSSVQNLHSLATCTNDENEMPMETSILETSSTSITSTLAFTPVASLRTPKAKRPALSRFPSFGSADIANFGTEV